MPPTLPPQALPGAPTRYVLPAGTTLWRVHRSGRPVHDFDAPRLVKGFGGGRFDSTRPNGFPYLYCSPDAGTALAERFVRDLDFSVTATRMLPRRALQSRTASVCQTTTDLNLLSLASGPDLAAVGQDGWLLSARGPDLDLTRRWAAWLRDQARWAQGFVWQSGVDLPKPTMVLFGDTCGVALAPVDDMAYRLDDPDREGWLRYQLKPHRVVLDPVAPQEKPRIFINYRSDNAGLAAGLLDRELTRRLDDADDWVRREIREAAAYRVPVAPVLVGARPRLSEADLPADIRVLVEDQFVHLPAGFGEADVTLAVDRLLERFRGLDA